MPSASSRASQRRDIQRIAYEDTPFGAVLQRFELPADPKASVREDDSLFVDVWVAHPLATLQQLISRSPDFAALLSRTFNATGDKFSICIYNDEVECGNELQGRGARKLEMVYWSILEFGPLLSHETYWFTLTALRHDERERVIGGMSRVVATCLRTFFGNDGSPNISHGIMLRFPGRDPRLVTACLKVMTQDERAHKGILCCRGSGGLMLCALCSNVYNIRFRRPHGAGDNFVPSTCLDINMFELHTNESVQLILTALKVLADGGASPSELDRVETELGWLHNPWNVLTSGIDFNIDIVCYDWAHCLFIGGIFNREVDALMALLSQHGLGVGAVHVFLEAFVWPRAYASGRDVCKSGRVKGPMSELISFAPVLGKYLLDVVVPRNVCSAQVQSMLLLIRVLKLLLRCNGGGVTAEQLQTAIVAHLRQQQRAYGFALWIPKSHYLLHVAATLRKFGYLLNTLVNERKHKVVKRLVHGRQNTTSFERGVLEDIIAQQYFDIDIVAKSGSLGLQSKSAPSQALLESLTNAFGSLTIEGVDVFVSNSLRTHRGEMMSKDIVTYHAEADLCIGELQFFLELRRECFACISPWTVLDGDAEFKRCLVKNEFHLINAAALQEACIYSRASVGSVSHVHALEFA